VNALNDFLGRLKQMVTDFDIFASYCTMQIAGFENTRYVSHKRLCSKWQHGLVYDCFQPSNVFISKTRILDI